MTINNGVPTRKVALGVGAGAIMVIVVWVVKQFGHIDVPAEVAMAAQTLLVFIGQYYLPDAKS